MAEFLAPALDGADIAGTVRANGIELAYEQFGRDDAPALVLIMGLGGQLIAWPDAFCRALADTGLRVLRFDNRDSGNSTKLHTQRDYDRPGKAFLKARFGRPICTAYQLEDMAADTLGLMDALGIERAHLVGASMGAMIAQLVATAHPSRVASLTSIMSTTGEKRLPRSKLKILRRLGKRMKTRDLDAIAAYVAKTMAMIGSPRIGRSLEDWEIEVRRNLKRCHYPAGTARQILAVLAAGSCAEQLASLRCPALVVHGRADPLVPVAHGQATARTIPQARYEEIAGMGHDLPPRVLPRLVRWISELVWNENRHTQT